MTSKLRIGLRREVLILVPVSLLLVVVLSTFTLFAYRNALTLLAEERRTEIGRWALAAAAELTQPTAISEDDLRRGTRGAIAAAVVASDGSERFSVGDPLAEGSASLLEGRSARGPWVFGPGGAARDRIVAFVDLRDGQVLRIDYPATQLAGQLRTLKLLFGIVLAADLGTLLLLLLFLRRLLTPYEAMLDRARQLERQGTLAMTPLSREEIAEPDDEMAFLLATFDRALRQLSQAEGEPRLEATGGSDELVALGRTLMPSFDSGLLLLDRRGGVLALNTVGAHLLSVPVPEPGTPVARVLASHGELAGLLAEAIATGRGVKRRECRVGELALGLTVHALRPTGSEVRGFLVLFADLTQARRDAEENRLAESLAQLGELAAGVAHELRNSLGTLRGYLGLLERQGREGGHSEAVAQVRGEYLAEMRRETDQLQRVLEDFLAFARPGTVRPRSVDLAALARRCASDPALAGTPVTIRAEGPAVLQGDPQLLERALRNLLRNAVEAQRRAGHAEGPRVVIERRPDRVEHLAQTDLGREAASEEEGAPRDEIELRVEDRGPGVPDEMVDRLFLPFATDRADGVGLGLALTHRIVTLHGGSIRYEPREGGGARFCLLFPVGKSVTESSDRGQP